RFPFRSARDVLSRHRASIAVARPRRTPLTEWLYFPAACQRRRRSRSRRSPTMSLVRFLKSATLPVLAALATVAAASQPSPSSELEAIIDALLTGGGRGNAPNTGTTPPAVDDLLARLPALAARALSPRAQIY